MTPPEQLLSTDEVDLCHQAFGEHDDPAVLLIGGAQASMDWWPDALCEQLAAAGRRVVRYDHRDTGRSTTDPPGAPTYDGSALRRDALAVLQSLGPDPVHVVGVSMGGGIAQTLAITRPELVASLTVIASSAVGGVPSESLPAPTAAVLASFEDPELDPDWSDREAVVGYFLAGEELFAGSPGVDVPAVRAVVGSMIDRSRAIASAGNHRLVLDGGGDEHEPALDVAEIAAPTLVVHGSDDPLFPIDHGRALADAVPSATLLVVEGMGHQVPPRATWPVVVPALVEHTSAEGTDRPPHPRRLRPSAPRRA